MNSWKDMLEGRGGGEGLRPPVREPSPAPSLQPEIAPGPDPAEYRPWILQRGRGRPALFLDLRRFEPKTGLLIGCQMSYPHLIAVDYMGEQMVALDFGARQFVIEGSGLGELPQWLQQGMVLAIQEYSPRIWPTAPATQIVRRIVPVNAAQAARAGPGS